MSSHPHCGHCDAELIPESAFCHVCGAALGDGAGPREVHEQGERKPLTVLFVDAFGSVGLATPIDAERWLEIVDRFFSIVSLSVRRFGGTIDRLTGEGIKVLFGAPAAQENHARQACHAALHLTSALSDFGRIFRAAAGVEFSIRMGINSGEVVLGRIGTGGESDFTSQGHTAALAAQLEQLAEPDKIYLTESTAGLVAGFFELREVGALPIRGASSSVRVYELLRATERRSRLDVGRERLSPFVGRESEMAELERAFERVQSHGPRVVGLVGEPGVGKSRLCDELVGRLRARGVTVHQLRCAEHGRWIPFHAALPLLRDQFDVGPGDPPELVRGRIAARLDELDPALRDALPVLLEALGVAEGTPPAAGDAAGPVREIARVIRLLVEARSDRAPSVIVVDDQQWMDAASEAALASFMAGPPRTPLLLLASYRPGFTRPWMEQPGFDELAVSPLAAPAAAELATSLLGGDASLAHLPRRIAERTGGNPYFVEEIVHALAENGVLEGERGSYKLGSGVTEVAVPRSLQAVLAARVDQLGDDAKSVLQAASVIGPEFAVPLLPAVSGVDAAHVTACLTRLEETGFVTVGDDVASYRFRHPLLQESVYRSLLRERRAVMHRAVAREAERLQPPGVSGQPAAVAFHYEAAGDHLDAARWHARAAHGTVLRDPVQTVEHWRRVRALTKQSTDREAEPLRLAACEAILRLGPHGRLGREEAITLLIEGRRLAAHVGDVRMTALLISTQGLLLGAAGDVAAAITHNREAFELATAVPDRELVLLFGARLVLGHRVAGDLDAAREVADRVLAGSEVDGEDGATLGGSARHQLELARAATSLDRGDLARGAAELDALLEVLRSGGDALTLAWALTASALVVRLTGESPSDLLARVDEGVALARRLGLPGMLARALGSACASRLAQARWAEARDLALEAADSLRGEAGAIYIDVNTAMLLAEAHLGLGEAETALAHAREGLAAARARSSKLGEVDASLALGRVLVEIGDEAHVEARSVLETGRELAAHCRMGSREPHFQLALAHLARRRGEAERAKSLEHEALAALAAIGASGHAARVAALRATSSGAPSAPIGSGA